jgi:quercetin dioxygenase-like cupin family protein
MALNPLQPSGLAGVTRLEDLIAFQPGAVVSRTVVKRPAGTVTAFAFDAGEGLSEHTAAFDALVVGVAGDAEITIAGAPHRVTAGAALLLPAGQPHALKAGSPFKMLLIMIRE